MQDHTREPDLRAAPGANPPPASPDERLRYMQSLADHIPSMLAYWGRDLRCRYANQAYWVWFGVHPDALIGHHIRELLGDKLFEMNRPHIEAALRGEPQTFEREVPGPGGRVRHSLAHYIPDWRDGQVQGFFVEVTDVTALKDTEAALRREIEEREHVQARLRAREAELLQAQRLSGIGSWEWDGERDALSWSDQMYRVMGRDPLLGPPRLQDTTSYYSPAILARRQAAIDQTLNTGQPYKLETEFVREDGRAGWVLSQAEAIRDAQGRIVGMRGTAQDVTERHVAEQLRRERDLAEAANLAKSQLLTHMSHELRTPLNAILGFGRLIATSRDANDRLRAWADHVVTAGRQLLALVDNLLELTRVDRGTTPLQIVEVDLHEALEAALACVADQAGQAGVALINHVAPQPPLRVLADAARLQQILINLLSNAIKYNRSGGHADIRARASGTQVELDIEDTGIGMHAEQMMRLFTPFERLGTGLSNIPGAGVGLALAQRLAEGMGGGIRAHSEPQAGSTFTLVLARAVEA